MLDQPEESARFEKNNLTVHCPKCSLELMVPAGKAEVWRNNRWEPTQWAQCWNPSCQHTEEPGDVCCCKRCNS